MNQDAAEVQYELLVLGRMIQQLPEPINTLLSTQVLKIVGAYARHAALFKETIDAHIGDVILAIKLQEFDLDATRREKAELEARLNNCGES